MKSLAPNFANYIVFYLSIAVLLTPLRLSGTYNTAYLVLIISFLVSFIIAGQFFLVNGVEASVQLNIF